MIQRHKWWFIGGAILLLVFLFLRGRSSLPSSSAGSGNIQLPNTQEVQQEHALSDAITSLSGALWLRNHPTVGSANPPVPVGIAPTVTPTTVGIRSNPWGSNPPVIL